MLPPEKHWLLQALDLVSGAYTLVSEPSAVLNPSVNLTNPLLGKSYGHLSRQTCLSGKITSRFITKSSSIKDWV